MVARGIVDRLADEVVAMAGAMIRRLRLGRLDPDVVLGGGVFRTREPGFHQRIRDGVAAVAPRAQVVPLTVPPVAGAALTRSGHARGVRGEWVRAGRAGRVGQGGVRQPLRMPDGPARRQSGSSCPRVLARHHARRPASDRAPTRATSRAIGPYMAPEPDSIRPSCWTDAAGS